MNNKISKIIKRKSSLTLAILLACSFNASATMPTVDPPNLIEKVTANIQDAANWAEESTLMTMAMELKAYYDQIMIQVDAMTEMMNLQKSLKLEEELHNLWVKEANEPDPTVARDCAVQVVGKAVECNNTNALVQSIDKDQAIQTNFSATPEEARTARLETLKTIADKCRALTYANPVDNNDKLTTSMCLRGGILLGTETNSTLTANEANAADLMINILAGSAPEHKESQRYPEGSAEKAEALNAEMRYLGFRSLAYSSLSNVVQERKSAGSNASKEVFSTIGALDVYSGDRWGSPEWIQKVGMATENPDDSFSKTQLLRMNTKMNAFRLHLDIMRYKQQLRMEALQAANLIIDSEMALKSK